MSRTFPSGDYEMWEKRQMLLPHFKEVASHALEDRKSFKTQATSMFRVGRHLYLRGEYTEADWFGRSSVDIRDKVLGREHPDELISINEVWLVLSKQGKY